jgi:hypothetical protein
MRTLQKNARTCYYANPTGETEMLKDEWGNLTSEAVEKFTEPVKLKANYSQSAGEEVLNVFGSFTDYSKTMVFAGECPLVEGSRVWIKNSTAEDSDYIVTKVAESLNFSLVALKETV